MKGREINYYRAGGADKARLNYELSFEEVGGFEQSINSRSKISNSILPFSSLRRIQNAQ